MYLSTILSSGLQNNYTKITFHFESILELRLLEIIIVQH